MSSTVPRPALPGAAPATGVPTIGVLGRTWRASVGPGGTIEVWDGLGALHWWVAADDRWHTPASEPTVRQRLVDGTPVVETRVRIPQGDAVQRVYAVADHGGLTVVEVENDSPLPIAVAFHGLPLLTARPPADVPIEGIDLPAGTIVLPVGHRSTVTVAIAHAGARSGALPGGLPPAVQVARGWSAMADRAGRLLVPDEALREAVTRERCQLMLDGPADGREAPVEHLLGVDQLVRMGSVADEWVPEVADAVHALVSFRDDPLLPAALDAAVRVCTAAGESRAVADLGKVALRLLGGRADVAMPAVAELGGVRLLAALERTIAVGGDLFPQGIPAGWLGQNFEVYGVPTGASSAVSFALRWHGARPAVLWECTGSPVLLTSSGAAPEWRTSDATGEALWPEPAGASRIDAVADDSGVSFS
jgi:hypothetical protein